MCLSQQVARCASAPAPNTVVYPPQTNPIRQVVQLAGYVSEHSAYHHGEASLNGTITAMAQNYTGSNNLNLLTPGGQFGTRLMGGKVKLKLS